MKRFVLTLSICLCTMAIMAQGTLSFAYGSFGGEIKPEKEKREHRKPFIGLHFGAGATVMTGMSVTCEDYYSYPNYNIWEHDYYYYYNSPSSRNVTNNFNYGTFDIVTGLDMAFDATEKFAMGLFLNYETVSHFIFGPLMVFGDYNAGKAWIFGIGADITMGSKYIKIHRNVTYEYDTNYEQNKNISEPSYRVYDWKTTSGTMTIYPFCDSFVAGGAHIRLGRQVSPQWYITGFVSLGCTDFYAYKFEITDKNGVYHRARGGNGFVFSFGLTAGYRFDIH